MLMGPRQSGFTLIEISTTLAVMAMLLFALAPEITSMITNSRIRSTAESLQQGLQRARNEALSRNREVRLWLVTQNPSNTLDNTCALSANSTAWIVSINDPSGQCAAASSDTVDPMVIEKSAGGTTSANVTVSALQSDGTAATSVAFDGFGRVAGAAAISRIDLDNISSSSSFRPLRIALASGGSLRLCEPRVTDASDPRRC